MNAGIRVSVMPPPTPAMASVMQKTEICKGCDHRRDSQFPWVYKCAEGGGFCLTELLDEMSCGSKRKLFVKKNTKK